MRVQYYPMGDFMIAVVGEGIKYYGPTKLLKYPLNTQHKTEEAE
jgi:hypothetical protein